MKKGAARFSLVVFFLAGCLSLGAQAPPSPLTLHVSPGLTIPVGNSAAWFGLGGSASLRAEYVLPFFPTLYVLGSVGYDYDPLSVPGRSVSIPNGLVGAGARFTLAPWLAVQAFVAGGYQFGFLNDPGALVGSGNPCFVAGAGALARLSPTIGVEAGVSYRFFGGTYSGLEASIGTVFTLPPARAKTPAPVLREAPRGLLIENIQMEPVYSVLHKFYDDHPIGRLTLTNTEATALTGVTLTLNIRKYMDIPRKCLEISELKPGESRAVDLTALFNDSILDVTEETKVAAEVTCTWARAGASQSATESPTVRVYGRNSITWDDNRKACAFVTAKDPAVLLFSNNVNSFVKAKTNPAVNANLQAALAVHEALRLYGISYVSNAISYADVTKNKATVDFLKFPRQTFEYHSGDCSDLSILYSALLESMQIPTAFITIPGHIFMAVSLALTPEDARKAFVHSDDLIFREDNTTWLPIEVTERTGDFLVAWAEGAKEWRENTLRGQAEFYPVREGWKVYEPVQFPGTTSLAVPAQDRVVSAFKDVTDRFVTQEISTRVAELQGKIRSSGSSPKSLNDLGVLYARYGLYENAERQFKLVTARAAYVPALINLGNLAYVRSDFATALQYFDAAYASDPKNPAVLLGLSRANQETENYGDVRKYYGELKAADPGLAERFAYLSLRGEEATRAAEISKARDEIVWAEQ